MADYRKRVDPPAQYKNMLGDRSNKPLSVQMADIGVDVATPLGTITDIQTELEKEKPNYAMIAGMTGLELLGPAAGAVEMAAKAGNKGLLQKILGSLKSNKKDTVFDDDGYNPVIMGDEDDYNPITDSKPSVVTDDDVAQEIRQMELDKKNYDFLDEMGIQQAYDAGVLNPEEWVEQTKALFKKQIKNMNTGGVEYDQKNLFIKAAESIGAEELVDLVKNKPTDPKGKTLWGQKVSNYADQANLTYNQMLSALSSVQDSTRVHKAKLTEKPLPIATETGEVYPTKPFQEKYPVRTAEQRALDEKAYKLGFKDTVYHTTRAQSQESYPFGEEFTEFKLPDQLAGKSPFNVAALHDLLGVHVGTARAAAERAEGYGGTGKFTMELRAKLDKPAEIEDLSEILGLEKDYRPFDNEFIPSEADLRTAINRESENLFGLKAFHTRDEELKAVKSLRQKLAKKGYTHIPYVNDVEDKESISYIMLTDRPKDSPAVLRDFRAEFDPEQRANPDLRMNEGGVASWRRALTEDEIPAAFRNVYGDRTKKPLSVKGAEIGVEFTPAGTIFGLNDIKEELQKENPDYYKIGMMAGVEAIGLIPGLDKVAVEAIRAGAKKVGLDKVADQTDALLSGPKAKDVIKNEMAGFTGQNPPTYIPKDEPVFDPKGNQARVSNQPFVMFREPIAEFTRKLTMANSFPSKGMTGAEFLRLLEKNAESIPPSSYKEGLVDKDKRYTREELLDAVIKGPPSRPRGGPESLYYSIAELDRGGYENFQRQSGVGFQGGIEMPGNSYFAIPIVARTSGANFLAKSQHFGNNTTAHVRGSIMDPMVGYNNNPYLSEEFKEVVGTNPYLLVEEIQSDLLQKGYVKPKNSFDQAWNATTSQFNSQLDNVTYEELYGPIDNEISKIIKELDQEGLKYPRSEDYQGLDHRTYDLKYDAAANGRFLRSGADRGFVTFDLLAKRIKEDGRLSSWWEHYVGNLSSNNINLMTDEMSGKVYTPSDLRNTDKNIEAYEEFEKYLKKENPELSYDFVLDKYENDLDRYAETVESKIDKYGLSSEIETEDLNFMYRLFKENKATQDKINDTTALPPVRKNKQTVEEGLKILIAKADQKGVDKIVIPPADKIAAARNRTIDPNDKGDRFYRTYVTDLNKALEDLEKNYPVTVHRDVNLPYKDKFEIPPNRKGIIIDISKLREQFQVDKPRQFAEGGAVGDMNRQMELFARGGLRDDGMNMDPVSGNEVPSGSLAEEVRDDIPAQLSEGEYVVPADVVRYYGVKFFEDLRSDAKMGLQQMEANGRIGGEPVMQDEYLGMDEEDIAAAAQMAATGVANGGLMDKLAMAVKNDEVLAQGFASGGLVGEYAVGGMAESIYNDSTQVDSLVNNIMASARRNPEIMNQLAARGVQVNRTNPQMMAQQMNQANPPRMGFDEGGGVTTTYTPPPPGPVLGGSYVFAGPTVQPPAPSTAATPSVEFCNNLNMDYDPETKTCVPRTATPTISTDDNGGSKPPTPTGDGTGGIGFGNWAKTIDWSNPEGWVDENIKDVANKNQSKLGLGLSVAAPGLGLLAGAGMAGQDLANISKMRAMELTYKAAGMDDQADLMGKMVSDYIAKQPEIVDDLEGVLANGTQRHKAIMKNFGFDDPDNVTPAEVKAALLSQSAETVSKPTSTPASENNNNNNDNDKGPSHAEIIAAHQSAQKMKADYKADTGANYGYDPSTKSTSAPAGAKSSAGNISSKGTPTGGYVEDKNFGLLNKGGLMSKKKKKK